MISRAPPVYTEMGMERWSPAVPLKSVKIDDQEEPALEREPETLGSTGPPALVSLQLPLLVQAFGGAKANSECRGGASFISMSIILI